MVLDIEHWTFGGLKRGEDGRFRDEDLAKVLMNATATPAASFGARGTPAIMRLNEVMGIEQSRRWGCCSLNDFRKASYFRNTVTPLTLLTRSLHTVLGLKA